MAGWRENKNLIHKMSDAYNQLLDATIQHLEDLKSRGVRNVAVSPETLRVLSHPAKAIVITASMPNPAELSLALPGETTLPPPLDPKEKAAAFGALRERALVCVKCPHLASSRKNVVFGVGSIDAQLMFVGEAPGADEDEQG